MHKPFGTTLLVFGILAVFLGGCTPAPTPLPAWSLVAIGDSIGFNSPMHCPGCTGFVDRYAAAITEATGHPVEVQNLTNIEVDIDYLLDALASYPSRRDALANADIVIVGIAHNDTAWNSNDDPCDGAAGNTTDWSLYNTACAAGSAELYRPKFESLFSQIATLRAGKPTLLLTINAYNFWNSQPGTEIPAEAMNLAREVLDAWNGMICEAARENDFLCADIYHAFNGPDGLTPAPELIAKGNIHPSDKGNEVIAQVLLDLGLGPLTP